DERGDKRCERRTDHERDGERDEVAAEDEFPEVLHGPTLNRLRIDVHERARAVRLADELGAVAVAEPEQWRRAEQLESAQARLQLLERAEGVGLVGAGDEDADEVAKRRVAERPPPLELAGEEAGDVVAGGVLDRARLRLECLNDDASGRLPPAPAGELGEELERPLLGAEVGEAEAGVGVDDGGELDAGEVVSLRDHLRADEDGAVGGGEALERRAELAGLRDGVRVEADPLELGDALLELALEPLRAGADPGELGGAAGGARLLRRLARAAVVAAERSVPVQRQRDVAVGAAAGGAAGAAVEGGRDPAAVEEEDRLAAVLGETAELGEERAR